jgi:hypothetical protein
MQEELKRTRKEMDELKLKIATGSIGSGGGSQMATRLVTSMASKF